MRVYKFKDIFMRMALLGCFILIPSHLIATDWYIVVVDTTPDSGVYGTSIALDSLDVPHIAYCRYLGSGLMYASWHQYDSTWITESVFDTTDIKWDIEDTRIGGTQPSLAFDSNGYPHISFSRGDLGYAWKDSIGWHTARPYPGPWIFGTSLALDKDDYPHIGYFVYINDSTGWVLHTFLDESGWHNEVLDTVGDFCGHPASVVIDKSNQVHIAYGYLYEEGTGSRAGIKYGVRDNSGKWNIERVVDTTDTSCDLDGAPTIQLDSMECPHISYRSMSVSGSHWIGRLKYATKKDGIWHFEIIDIGEDTRMGGRNFLALDQFGNPHISYRGGAWLKYAWKSDGEWYIEKLDSICVVINQASYTGLAIDRDGYAHISYNREIDWHEGSTTRYATGYPEMGIEIEPEHPLCASLNVYPSIGKQSVKIEFTLNRKGIANLSIYNIAGQEVIGLVSGVKDCGKHTTYWDTKDEQGRDVPAGVYFITFKGEKFRISRKVVVLK